MSREPVSVVGLVSGDHECWCFLVTREDFFRIKGTYPIDEFDTGPFAKPNSPYQYKIYPDDLIQRTGDSPFRLTITIGEP